MGCGSSTVAAEPTIAVVPGGAATPAGSGRPLPADEAASPPSSTPMPNANNNQQTNNTNRPAREQYSSAHATSLPAPRVSISAASGVARAETVSGGKVESKKSSGNMPAVRELLTNVPIKNALLPNFYRSAAFNSSGNPSLEPSSLDHHSSPPEGWSDSDEELDEEEHKETLQMLNELTMLSVPSPGLRQHYSSSEGNPLSQVPHDSKLIAATPTPYGEQLSWDAIAQSNLVASGKASQTGSPGSHSTLKTHHSAASSIVTSSGSVAMVPHRKASQGQPETLFHGFYAKRCIHTVKKSMLSSGMFLTFKDMFESLDSQNSGFISKNSWTNLLMKLGLALDSAASLSRIAGLNDSPTITLEQFATVMALSLHGPYLRMLQSSQNSVRREVFLGGEKAGATWRQDIVLPFFTKMKIPFFSAPNKKAKALLPGEGDSNGSSSEGEWNAEGVILEAVAKSQCQMMLYVVDKDTRSIASMVEASEHITSLKEVLLVMEDVKAGSTIGGETLSAPEAKDLNRGRAYLADVAHRNAHGGVTVFKHMTDACDYVVKRFDGSIVRPSLKVFTKPVLAIAASTSNGPTPAQTPALKPSNPSHMHGLSTSKNGKAGLQVTVPPIPGGSPEATDVPLLPPSSASTFSMTNSPLAALMSGQARRHSTGLPQRVASPTMSNGALPPTSKGSALAVPGAHHTSHSISFNPEEWPANPQPTDFDRYIASAHFSECSRIVFKHQVLLCKRAAAKAQLNAAVLNSASQIGNPSTSGPPGLFRMTSSPIVTNIRRSPNLAPVEPSESAESDAVPDLVPQHSRVPSSSDRFRQSESFSSAGTSRVVLSVNQSDEDSQVNGNGSANERLRSEGSFSTNPLQRSPSQTEGAAASPIASTGELKEKEKDSPDSVKRPLSTSHSQSKLLDPLQAAGLNVNIIPPEPLSQQPPPAADGSNSSSVALAVDDVVPTAHLFTMLIRLHEIIQLATGIHFLHPYPSLVSATAEGKLSDVLRISEWMQLSKQVFSQLRGIHEAATAPPSASPTASPDVTDSPMLHQSHLSTGGAPTESPSLSVDGIARRRSLNRSTGGTGSPLIGSSGISPHQFIRQLSTVGQNPPSKRLSDPLTLEPGISSTNNNNTSTPNPSGSTSYTKSSRAKAASMDSGSPVDREKIGLGSGGKVPAPTAEKPPVVPAPSVASSPVVNYSQVAQRVKARITAQKKVVESLQAHKLASSGSNASSNSNSAGSSQSPSVSVNASMASVAAAALSQSLTPSKVEEMSSLSASDLTKLAASVSASLAHDQLLLKEMMPSFTAMYKAIDASEAGTVSMDQVSSFLTDKLLLPTASVTCLMDVLNVALANCLFEATSVTNATANTGTPDSNASATGTDAATPIFTADSFDRSRLTHAAFGQVLSKALHLQSNAFSSFLASDAVNFVQKSKRVCSQVFLGGSCNPTTWRKDEAIPILEDSSISYYNPQLDNWSNELVLIESLVKQNSEILLFVIDSETRAIASMIEASEYICSGRDVVLVVKNMDQAGKVNNEALGAQQVMDLNRARSYVTDVAQRHGLDVFTDITLACEYIVTKLREKETKEAAYLAEVESFINSEEFVEKTYEEFFRCDLQQTSKIAGTQLLLACLHLEQDLRPLLPPQSVKHRQPSMSDIEFVGKMFGAFNTSDQQYELNAEQFLEFSRMLFRNVCAHVKL